MIDYTDIDVVCNLPHKLLYRYEKEAGLWSVYVEKFPEIKCKATRINVVEKFIYKTLKNKLTRLISEKSDLIKLGPNYNINLAYKHFKGEIYILDSISMSADDITELYVTYHNKNDETKSFIRKADEFFSLVNKNKYPDCTQKFRFELIRERHSV